MNHIYASATCDIHPTIQEREIGLQTTVLQKNDVPAERVARGIDLTKVEFMVSVCTYDDDVRLKKKATSESPHPLWSGRGSANWLGIIRKR